MDIERIKETISKNILLKVLLMALLILAVVIYFRVYTTTGVYYDNAFLKKEVVASDSHYIGSNKYGGLHITVKGLKNKDKAVEVIYRLPNSLNKQYTVAFEDAGNWDLGIESIKDEKGNVVFDGDYRADSYFLFDKNGEPLVDDAVRITVDDQIAYDSSYEFSLKNVADFANFADDTIRGNIQYLMPAIFLLIFLLIDIKYPLFFFTLEHFIDVKDPEPSDLYLAMQRASRYVLPVIIIALFIAAIQSVP